MGCEVQPNNNAPVSDAVKVSVLFINFPNKIDFFGTALHSKADRLWNNEPLILSKILPKIMSAESAIAKTEVYSSRA
jgi:hypothetical protein